MRCCGQTHSQAVSARPCSRHSSCRHSLHTYGYIISGFGGWGQPACGVVVGGASRLGFPAAPPRRLRLSPLHCSNNMLLSQPGCAAGTAPAGRVYTHMGMSYQGLVAGGNLLAEWRSEAQAGLSTRRPRRLRPSPLDYCSNDMFLPRPGCAAGIALAGTVHTLIGISYQGLVAGGNLVAEGRSEARAGLATRRPQPAAALPTAPL